MKRAERLARLVDTLGDGAVHTADALGDALGVSVRTIYRDVETLQASGVPVSGAPGRGFRASEAVVLPPLTLTPSELEALNLGIAILSEAADAEIAAAAARLGDKLDAALPERGVPDTEAWKFAVTPFANLTRGLGLLPTLRGAVRARQKLALRTRRPDGAVTERHVRPLLLDHWARVWTLTAWCERRSAFRVFRVDLIETAEALPELFDDEPGKTLEAYRRLAR